MKRKIVILFMVMLLALGMLDISALATGGSGVIASGSCGVNSYWSLTEEGVLTVSGAGSIEQFFMDDYEVKDKIVEVIVEGEIEVIEAFAFRNCDNLKKVVLREGVKKIHDRAFDFCDKLEEVILPNSLEILSKYAFTATPWVENLQAQNDFVILGSLLYEYRGTAEKVEIPQNIKSISNAAFAGNKYIKEVVIPDGVRILDTSAFENCINLQKVNIPNTVDVMYRSVFKGCRSLNNVEIPGSIGIVADSTFMDCENLDTVKIAEGIEILGFSVFANTALKSIMIPKSVKEIGEWTFGYDIPEDEQEMPIKIEGFKVYGYIGSKAEAYAKEKGFEFVAVSEIQVVPEKTTAVYTQGSESTATIYCTGELKNFMSVEMDGKLVEPSNYTLKEGSTILTFKSTYLERLAPGNHTVKLNYTTGSVETVLKISDNVTIGGVQTGDNVSANLWFVATAFSMILAVCFVVKKEQLHR